MPCSPARGVGSPSWTGRPVPSRQVRRPGFVPCSWRRIAWPSRDSGDWLWTRSMRRSTTRAPVRRGFRIWPRMNGSPHYWGRFRPSTGLALGSDRWVVHGRHTAVKISVLKEHFVVSVLGGVGVGGGGGGPGGGWVLRGCGVDRNRVRGRGGRHNRLVAVIEGLGIQLPQPLRARLDATLVPGPGCG